MRSLTYVIMLIAAVSLTSQAQARAGEECGGAAFKAAVSCGKAGFDAARCIATRNPRSCISAARGAAKCIDKAGDAADKCRSREIRGCDFGGRNGVRLNVG